MSPSYNVVIFGDPKVDRRAVIKMAAGGVPISDTPPEQIFQSTCHDIYISGSQFHLYDTAGLSATAYLNDPTSLNNTAGPSDNDTTSFSDTTTLSEVRSLNPTDALNNLYKIMFNLSNGVNLLVYVVTNKPTVENYKLFHDIFCQKKVPIILISTGPHIQEEYEMRFKKHLHLHLDSPPFSNHEDEVQNALRGFVMKSPWRQERNKWFAETAGLSWSLLSRSAGWSLTDCNDALFKVFNECTGLARKAAQDKCQEVTAYIKKHYVSNVIFFGSIGAGKSSIINMFAKKDFAETSSNARGTTLQTKAHRIESGGYHYNLYDTVGLGGAFTAENAAKALHELVCHMDGGVSLLVYVTRPRLEACTLDNYRRLYEVICQKQVPIVVVITGLEEVEPMDAWWEANKYEFDRLGMSFTDHACITATKGKRGMDGRYYYEAEYNFSKEKVADLLANSPRKEGWKMDNMIRWKVAIRRGLIS